MVQRHMLNKNMKKFLKSLCLSLILMTNTNKKESIIKVVNNLSYNPIFLQLFLAKNKILEIVYKILA